jgi:hypothetical protein
MGHVHRNQHHHGRRLRASHVQQPRRLHGRPFCPRFRRRDYINGWARVRQRNGTSRVSRRVYGRVQHLLVRWRNPGKFRALCDRPHCRINELAHSDMAADGFCRDSLCLLAVPAGDAAVVDCE